MDRIPCLGLQRAEHLLGEANGVLRLLKDQEEAVAGCLLRLTVAIGGNG